MSDLTEEKEKLREEIYSRYKFTEKGAQGSQIKVLTNFRHIELMLILPNAKRLFDSRRYPLDCCFSMFKQLFAQGQEFFHTDYLRPEATNDYIKLMQHWDNVLPKKVLRVNNEDLISDLEGQVTRILTFLELPFEKKEECISFIK